MPIKNNLKGKLVVMKNDEITPQEIIIEKDDVGILISEEKNHSSIFFIRVWKQVELNKESFHIIDIASIGDAHDYKICNICHKLKKTSEFSKNQNGKNNRSVRRPSCRSCRTIMEGTKISHQDLKKWRLIKPHHEAFECPICMKRTIAGVTSKVVLEHDHRTGKLGGWICDSCNTGLGRFKDDVKILESAINFLKKSY